MNLKEYLPEDITLTEFKNLIKKYMFEEVKNQYVLTDTDLRRVREIQKERYDTWEWNYGFSPKYSISKERFIENCGKIQLNMEVEKGIITKFITQGDYFGSGDSADLAVILIGSKPEEAELMNTLSGIDINYYYKNLTVKEFIKIIIQ